MDVAKTKRTEKHLGVGIDWVQTDGVNGFFVVFVMKAAIATTVVILWSRWEV